MDNEHEASLIVHSAAELVTCSTAGGETGPRRGAAQGEIGVIRNGAVAVKGERILAVGDTDEIIHAHRAEDTRLVDATGKTVTPGLVDAHTHLVWAGWRDEEYVLRLEGATSLQVMEAGGGIMATVRATRLANGTEL